MRKKTFCAFNANINHNHNEKSDVECSVYAGIIDIYNKRVNQDIRAKGRNLIGFDKEYLRNYLLGKL